MILKLIKQYVLTFCHLTDHLLFTVYPNGKFQRYVVTGRWKKNEKLFFSKHNFFSEIVMV